MKIDKINDSELNRCVWVSDIALESSHIMGSSDIYNK